MTVILKVVYLLQCFSQSYQRALRVAGQRVPVNDLRAFQAWIAWVTSFTCQDVSTGQETEDWAIVTPGQNTPAGIVEAESACCCRNELWEWYGACWSKERPELIKRSTAVNQPFLLCFDSWVDGVYSIKFKFSVMSLCYTEKLSVSFNMIKLLL